MNPCPCGYLGSSVRACRCSPDQVARYQARISGPLLDRIDLQVDVAALPAADLVRAPAGESSASIAARVRAARARAQDRQGCANQALSAAQMDAHCRMDEAATSLLSNAATRLAWSGRSIHRCLRVARSIADLAGSSRIGPAHVAEAVQYRRGLKTG